MSKEKIVFYINASDLIEDYGDLDQTIADFKEMGVNSVLLRTTFAKLVTKLKQHGFKVYAEFSCFEGEQVWQEHNDCIPIDIEGNQIEKESWYCGVNPANQRFSKELFVRFKKLLQNMNVDGIWFNHIHWPCYWQTSPPILVDTSFDEATINQFLQENKLALSTKNAKQFILGEGSNLWTQWKCSIITTWVKLAWEIRNQFAPDVKLGMFTVPWVNGEHDNAITKIIGQDYRMLAQYIDNFTPIFYHACENIPDYYTKTIKKINELTDRKVIPIYNIDNQNTITLEKQETDGFIVSICDKKGNRSI